ncbi:MAG: hypothetical protein BGO69_04675 [Bacteroidetes bacterium 46-16]|nr:MAG: hypothetical protein BGO69_04675 [Bacteroidetes bacterium 46-16]
MPFFDRISSKLLEHIPALYFAFIGSYDIISDALHHKLSMAGFIINALFILPLFLRHKIVYIVLGTLCSLFAMYGFFALFTWSIQYLNGERFPYPFDTFVIGPIFIALTLFFGLSLVYLGMKRSQGRNAAQPQA